MEAQPSTSAQSSLRKRLAPILGWTHASYALMSVFAAIIALIIVVWWPMVEEYASYYDPGYPLWMQVDWLLIGIFLAMSLLILAGANLKADAWIVMVGIAGGLAIESWGTQTRLWTYFTLERPPLWIIPAWPIASLSIDRLVRILQTVVPDQPERVFDYLYWTIFPAFYVLMWAFAWPTLDKPLTWLALLAVAALILTPSDKRAAVLIFTAGAGLGYFLERWGTTRECWTYYTHQTPPFFAVLAHGLAAVAFWKVLKITEGRITEGMRKMKTLIR
jgi:hypothetical protein